VVGVHDVIIHSNFGVNIFRGFRSTGGRILRFPIDFLVIVTTVLTLPRSL